MMLFFFSFGFFIFIYNFSLFAETQLNVNAAQVSYYIAWIGVIRVIIQTLLISRILKAFGEDYALRTGIIAMVISMVIFVISIDYLFVYVPLLFLSFGLGVGRPILTSKIVNSVTKRKTGTILGVNNSLNSIAQMITPIAGGLIIQYFPSQILPTISALFFLGILLFIKKNKS